MLPRKSLLALEITVTVLVKMKHDGHYLVWIQLARSAFALCPTAELLFVPVRLEPFVKIIDMQKVRVDSFGAPLVSCVSRK